MFKFHHSLVAAVTITVLFAGGSAAVAAEPPETKDLNEYSCKYVMRLSGGDRDIALALLHGYRLGKKNTTQFETQALSELTDSFIDYCLDHPGEKALPAFEKIAK